MTNERDGIDPRSTADTAIVAFAAPCRKEGEGNGVHFSLIPQTAEGGKLNFFMHKHEAEKLLKMLIYSVERVPVLDALDSLVKVQPSDSSKGTGK